MEVDEDKVESFRCDSVISKTQREVLSKENQFPVCCVEASESGRLTDPTFSSNRIQTDLRGYDWAAMAGFPWAFITFVGQ